MITEFVITSGETRKRLDVFLCHREPDISRTGIQRLIELGRIRLNTSAVKPSHIIKPGDRITMDTPQPEPLTIDGETLPLDILYEDTTLLVINKPAGIVVHPTSGNWSGTLLNALLSHFQSNEANQSATKETPKPGLVHRLDKHTSGIMVIAKTAEAHRSLTSQFEHHTITRVYEALVWGRLKDKIGVIQLPIGPDVKNHKLISPHTDQPKHAITEYQVIRHFEETASQVRLSPRTGRTHQLRVHMASINCPILGDTTYGGEKVSQIEGITIPRLMLHARTLGFHHPTLGHFQEYSVESPTDIQTVGQALGLVEDPLL
jgi:23S rRNA pseudouridine1911/1915/1917 synthase